jgi:hypothetical protein
MAKTIPPKPGLSLSSTWQKNPNQARKNAAAAIAGSLHRQVHTARMLLQTANRFPVYEASHERFVHSSARVLRHAESQVWGVRLEESDLVQIASEVEGLWFAIDALS